MLSSFFFGSVLCFLGFFLLSFVICGLTHLVKESNLGPPWIFCTSSSTIQMSAYESHHFSISAIWLLCVCNCLMLGGLGVPKFCFHLNTLQYPSSRCSSQTCVWYTPTYVDINDLFHFGCKFSGNVGHPLPFIFIITTIFSSSVFPLEEFLTYEEHLLEGRGTL